MHDAGGIEHKRYMDSRELRRQARREARLERERDANLNSRIKIIEEGSDFPEPDLF